MTHPRQISPGLSTKNHLSFDTYKRLRKVNQLTSNKTPHMEEAAM
jgi:hypothetical protein